MTDLATLQARLANAEAAYDALATGQLLRVGRHSVEQMEFQGTSAATLAAYIADLKGQIIAAGGQATGGRIRAKNIFHA